VADDFYGGRRPADEYEYQTAAPQQSHAYLLPAITRTLPSPSRQRVLDLGCGNGAMAGELASRGYTVTGVERSGSGLEAARESYPAVTFVEHDLEQTLPAALQGAFDIVLSAEVIEHMLLPRQLFTRAREALRPEGVVVLTTPYHGYLKNLLLALVNKYDVHWRPGWDYGHVKFFSIRTLSDMAEECGFEIQRVQRVGRVPQLAKSMVLTLRLDRQTALSHVERLGG
jgi:2-polyprenyl-3-methyl-5-hydroxy-6-metoxy-1,4-benzoquinol methylase